jgi:hypothetical protein
MSENWRVGGKVPLNVYEGDRPMFQCHTPEDAARVVELLNWPETEHQLRLAAEIEWAEVVHAAHEATNKLQAERDEERQLRITAEAARDRARDAFRIQGPCGHTENFLIGDEHGHFACLVCERDELKYRLQTWDDTHREQLESAVQARLAAEARIEKLRKVASDLLGYRSHLFGCQEHMTDFCTCGMATTARQAREALAESSQEN